MSKQSFPKILAVAALTMIISSPAFADPVPAYENMSTSWTDIQGLFPVPLGEWGLDDLNVAGGGDLASLTFAYGSLPGFFTPVSRADADVKLWVDDGNGTFGSEDSQIYTAHFAQISCSSSAPGALYYLNQRTVNFNLGDVVIPNNARIWAGLMFSNRTLGNNLQAVFFGPPTIGTTDGFVYQEDVAAGGLPNVMPVDAPSACGLGFALSVVPEPASLALLASGTMSVLRRRR